MFDDSQTDQKDEVDEKRMHGAGSVSNSDSGLSSGAISDPTEDSHDLTEPALIHPTTPIKDDASLSSDTNSDNNDSTSVSVSDGNDISDLAKIKRQALEQLSPLVHKLDQAPEEKFKTLMMMVQASDNQDLLNDAYEVAQKITNEKAKAGALLNIVNEINYFTQNN